MLACGIPGVSHSFALLLFSTLPTSVVATPYRQYDDSTASFLEERQSSLVQSALPSAQDALPRVVSIIQDNTPSPWAILGGDYGQDPIMNTHWSLNIGGNAMDPPLRITMKNKTGIIGPDVTNYGHNNTDHPLGLMAHVERLRNVVAVGEWIGSNKQLLDPATGEGLVARLAAEQAQYKPGVNGCGQLVFALLKYMRIPVPPELIRLAMASPKFMSAMGALRPAAPLGPVTYTEIDDINSASHRTAAFDVSNPNSPRQVYSNTILDSAMDFEDEAFAFPRNQNPPPIAQAKDEVPVDAKNFRVSKISDIADPRNRDRGYMIARADGEKSLLTTTTQKVATALGGAAMAASVVFVIMDFKEGNWVAAGFATAAAAFGAVEFALGVAESALALTGPVGWIVDLAVTALFSIIPLLFKKPPDYPPIDAQKIIQFAAFGHPDHTGNEKCQKSNPKCQAVYGPGFLHQVLKWEMFDAIIFLIQYNNGLAMTIPDMAKAFTKILVARPRTVGNSSVWISCKEPIEYPSQTDYYDIIMNKKHVCQDPSFLINRSKFTLPNIGLTADQVYPRITDINGNGDCKMIDVTIVDNAVAGMRFPDYNYTLINSPVSIACGITEMMNVNGNAVSVGGSTYPGGTGTGTSASISTGTGTGTGAGIDVDSGNSTGIGGGTGTGNSTGIVPSAVSNAPQPDAPCSNSGSQSTDGNTGEAFTCAPPRSPFQQLLNSTNSVCLTGTKGSICLPNGNYTAQIGHFGFDSSKVIAMTLPPAGGSVRLRGVQDHAYTTNQNSGNKDFMWAFSHFNPKNKNHIMEIQTSQPELPGACFFWERDQRGDVICFGPGGGDLPPAARKKQLSMNVYGGVTTSLYTGHYGDITQAKITHQIDDLDKVTETVGSNGGYGNKVVAIWIAEGGQSTGPGAAALITND